MSRESRFKVTSCVSTLAGHYHISISDHIIEETVAALRNGETLPPVTVYSDGATYWLFDGFHRIKACQILNLKEIEADVVPGTYQDNGRAAGRSM
jgi:uncharacterized ParB-like nuclease family protein